MTNNIRIGVIGGSGVYQMEALQDIEEVALETPFGKPSDSYIVGAMHGQKVAFLARHGRGHHTSPTRLNQRANIYGFKMLGVEYLIGVSACGSLQEQYAPGHIVIPDQLFDRTNGRALSFFDDATVGTDGIVVHVSVADPFCSYLSEVCHQAVAETGASVHLGGAFITIEGPRFSTKAESRVFRNWGMDIIGMTTTPEAFLAREAEMSYATLAMVTDYDCWHDEEDDVSGTAVMEVVAQNVKMAQEAVRHIIALVPEQEDSPYKGILAHSLITDPAIVPHATYDALELIIGPYMKRA